MCGIVGYVGRKAVQDILLAGLEKLEYRGYDSAGISLLEDGELRSVRAVGNLSRLREAVDDRGRAARSPTAIKPATTGIGHTRWATHGRVTEENAHPHYDDDNRVHVVVNGIVENYLELKQQLQADGATFSSETDVEVIAHLVSPRAGRGRRARSRPRCAPTPGSRATTPSSSSPPTSPTCWSAPAASAR